MSCSVRQHCFRRACLVGHGNRGRAAAVRAARARRRARPRRPGHLPRVRQHHRDAEAAGGLRRGGRAVPAGHAGPRHDRGDGRGRGGNRQRCHRSVGPGDLIEEGVTGLVYRSGEPAMLARQLRRLLDDPALLDRLQRGGAERSARFGPAAFARTMREAQRRWPVRRARANSALTGRCAPATADGHGRAGLTTAP